MVTTRITNAAPAKEGRPRKYHLGRYGALSFTSQKLAAIGECCLTASPWRSVHYYFRKWRDDGTLKRVHDQLRTNVRRQMGRHSETSIAIIDSQPVKTVEKEGRMDTTRIRK